MDGHALRDAGGLAGGRAPLRVQGTCTSRQSHPIGHVLVVGTQTPHYHSLFTAFPALVNSVLDVTAPLAVDRGVRKPGRTGFNWPCADRISAKPPFRLLVAAAVEIFYRTHLVVVCCRHGRHRSVTVGRAVARTTSARLWCPCIGSPFSAAIPAPRFLALLYSRLAAHAERHASTPFPVLDFSEVKWLFTREELATHLHRYSARTQKQWRLSRLRVLLGRVHTHVVLCWPTDS